jgi:hypothetical protein
MKNLVQTIVSNLSMNQMWMNPHNAFAQIHTDSNKIAIMFISSCIILPSCSKNFFGSEGRYTSSPPNS